MAEPFFVLEWPVAPNYEWRDWLGSDFKPILGSDWDLHHPNTYSRADVKKGEETGPILTALEGPHAQFHPMDRAHATLFREFASLDPLNLGELRSFACQYGWLGIQRVGQYVPFSNGSYHNVNGEPHVLWVREIAHMRNAIYLWEHPKYLANDRRRFEWLFDVHLNEVQSRLVLGNPQVANLRMVPTTLVAAMWLQLAQAIAGNKTFVKCKFCPKQIEISTAHTGFRTNREFCSDSCKTQELRVRQREAIKLWASGTPIERISKRTATKRETVKRWITREKGKTRRKPSRPVRRARN